MSISDVFPSEDIEGSPKGQLSVLATTTFALWFSMNPVMASMAGFIFVPMRLEFGWSATAISTGITLCYATTAICGLVIGRAIKRYGPRRIAPLLSCLFMISIAIVGSLSPVFPLFLILMVVTGAMGGGATPFAYASILPQWFSCRLGLALGIATAGIAVGQIAIPVVLHALNAAYGWRLAAVMFGMTGLALIAPATWFWYKERPVTAVRDASVEASGLTLGEAVRTTTFWRMVLAFFIISTAGAGCVFQLVPMMTSHGISVQRSAQILAISGAVLFVARLGAGWLLDFVSPWIVSTISFLGTAAGALLLWHGSSLEVLATGSALILLGIGTEGDLIPYMIRQQFGLRAYAAIYGAFGTVFGSGPLLGPLLVALSKDYLGGYGPVLCLFAISCVIAAGLLIGLRTTFTSTQDRAMPSDCPALTAE